MTAKLLTHYKQQIKELTLVPSGGGCFELTVDGKLLYSKLDTGEFPDEQKLVEEVGARLNKPVAGVGAISGKPAGAPLYYTVPDAIRVMPSSPQV